jgi:prepilin signal peptidase PulO-like enzyme (type II secretory pathway)
MQDLVTLALGWPAYCLAMACLGSALAYMTAFAADVAETLPEDGLLLPEMVRAVVDTRAPNCGRMWPVALSAVVCGLLPLVLTVSPAVLALFVVLAVPASIMDVRLMIIPEEFTWALLFSGALLSPWHFGAQDAIIGAAIACATTWAVMAGVELRTGLPLRSGADIAAAAAGGAWVGMVASGVFVLISCFVFIVYSLAAGALPGNRRFVPMGPALLVSIPLAPLATPWIEGLVARAL